MQEEHSGISDLIPELGISVYYFYMQHHDFNQLEFNQRLTCRLWVGNQAQPATVKNVSISVAGSKVNFA